MLTMTDEWHPSDLDPNEPVDAVASDLKEDVIIMDNPDYPGNETEGRAEADAADESGTQTVEPSPGEPASPAEVEAARYGAEVAYDVGVDDPNHPSNQTAAEDAETDSDADAVADAEAGDDIPDDPA